MKIFNKELFDEMGRLAASAPRRRTNRNVHENPSDCVQRFFNAVKPDSYIRPHRHATKWEFSMVVRGVIEVVLFDDRGAITERVAFGHGRENMGFEIEAGVWHTWLSLSDDAVVLEIKPGPYDPATAVEFSPWSPQEGVEGVREYMAGLRNDLP